MRKLAIVCAVLVAATGATGAENSADTAYSNSAMTLEGIGKSYMGREIPFIMGHEGAAWLERPERVAEEGTDKLIPLLNLKPTDVVADIGAGTGYFTFPMARLVPRGRVYAVDVQEEMLDMIRARIERTRARNVVPVHGSIASPRLPSNTIDVMLLVDAYHEFSYPLEMGRAMVFSLKPGGRLVLVEYRGEDESVPIKPLHKMTEAQARKEMAAIGLKWVSTDSTSLPWQHVMVFEKPRPQQ